MENCVYCGDKIVEVYEKEGQVLCPTCGRYRPPDRPRTGVRVIDSRVDESKPLVMTDRRIIMPERKRARNMANMNDRAVSRAGDLNLFDLNQMDGYQFEDLVEKLIQKMGFITKDRSRGGDGGIDIFAVNTEPILEGNYIIQCKRYSKPIAVSIVRDLYGVVHAKNANKGILITNSTFTQPSKDFAKGKQLELIDGEKLVRLLVQNELFKPKDTVHILPRGYSVLQFSLMNPLDQIINKMDEYKSGLILINKSQVSLNQWMALCQTETSMWSEYETTIYNILELIGSLINSDSDEDMKTLQDLSRRIIEANETVLNSYERIISKNPPDGMHARELQKGLLNVCESFMECWRLFRQTFESSMENISEDLEVHMTFSFVLAHTAAARVNAIIKDINSALAVN